MENIKIKLDLNINLDSLTELEKIVSRIEEQLKRISGIQFSDVFSILGSAASIGSFLKNIITTKKSIENEMVKIAKVIVGEKATIESAAKKIGSYIGEGLIDGIKKSRPKVEMFIEELGDDNVIHTMKKTLEISSPSKVIKKQ